VKTCRTSEQSTFYDSFGNVHRSRLRSSSFPYVTPA